jgi:hypothetical protein
MELRRNGLSEEAREPGSTGPGNNLGALTAVRPPMRLQSEEEQERVDAHAISRRTGLSRTPLPTGWMALAQHRTTWNAMVKSTTGTTGTTGTTRAIENDQIPRTGGSALPPCLHWVAHSRPNNYFVISTQARRLWLTHWDSCTYAPVLSPRLDTFLRYKKSVTAALRGGYTAPQIP